MNVRNAWSPRQRNVHPSFSFQQWWRAILATCSYVLFFTDIPRSGYGFESVPYLAISTNIFSVYGAYNYPVAKITSDSTTGTLRGMAYGPIESVGVWSYKFDTTSIGLRSLVMEYVPNDWNDCLLYKRNCVNETLPISTVFTMLDILIDHLVTENNSLQFSVEHYLVDHLHHVLSVGEFLEKSWRTFDVSIFRDASRISPSLCQSRSSPPIFCHTRWSNSRTLGPSRIGEVADHIRNKSISYSLQPGQSLDVIVIGGMENFSKSTGGIVYSEFQGIDIVTLYRVQTCDVAGLCRTDSIEDYRYEGGISKTDTVRWYRTLRLLRCIGQVYNIIRVLTLLGGCYFLHASPSQSKYQTLKQATQTCLSIPCQVIIYGSWFPVMLFAVAHAIDSPMLYSYTFSAWSSLFGKVIIPVSTVISVLSCHMRNVWIISLLAKTTLLRSTALKYYAEFGIPGIRGYVLILASFLSSFLDIRVVSIRNTDIVQSHRIPRSSHLGLLRHLNGMPCQLRYTGIWVDLKTLIVSGALVIVILRFKFKRILRLRTKVPHAALIFGSPLHFSTCWFGALFDPQTPSQRVSSEIVVHDIKAVHRSINVVWQTDPILYFLSLTHEYRVYQYRSKVSGEIFHHPLSLHRMALWKGNTYADTLEHIKTLSIHEMSWKDRAEIQ